MSFAEVLSIYQGSDGVATKALYARLAALGPMGVIAVNLFRAQKASERAKQYRGGRFRAAAYERKQWSIDNLCTALAEHGVSAGLVYGWGEDETQPVYCFVFYVDLPTGQVSFHSSFRGEGPDYPGGLGWPARRLRAAHPALDGIAAQENGVGATG